MEVFWKQQQQFNNLTAEGGEEKKNQTDPEIQWRNGNFWRKNFTHQWDFKKKNHPFEE